MEDKELKVNVYTRAPKVRLYLNNTLIGEADVNEKYKASFKVPYQAGTLKAINWDGMEEGKSVLLKTVGEPVALRMVADKTTLLRNGQDLSFILIELVDKNGNVVCDSERKIQIMSEGNSGIIAASGTASPNDMYSFRSMTPKLFKGRAMVIVRSGYEKGKIKVSVSSEGLEGDAITIKSDKTK